MSSGSPTVPKVALRALSELTGEPRFDVALFLTLRDALEHRLSKIEQAIQTYEERYGMTFAQFEARGKAQEIPDQFSYQVESDYLEWDGLVSRRENLQDFCPRFSKSG